MTDRLLNHLFLATSLEKFLFFLFILLLVFISGFFLMLLAYISKYLKISILQKSKQYSELNHCVTEGQIVFLGDSLTEFFKTAEFFPCFGVYNRGIASDTTRGVLDRLHDNVIAIKPRKVFLQIGTNDLGAKIPISRIVANIKEILTRMKESIPNVQLYLLSLYPVNAFAVIFSAFFVRNRRNKDLQRINVELEAFCIENNIKYINVFDRLTDEKGRLKKEFTVEGLHVSYDGYKVISEILEPYLKGVCQKF